MVNFRGENVECDNLDLATGGGVRTRTILANTFLLEAYDTNGLVYTTFATLTAGNPPTMDLSDSVTKSGGYIYRAGGTDVPVADGGTGASVFGTGLVTASGTSAFNSINSATAGTIVQSQGSGMYPTFSTATYPATAGTSGNILTSDGTNWISQAISGAGAITQITGNSGGAQVPSAGNFNLLGTGSLTSVGTANTQTFQLTGLTNHAVLVGAGTATITKVGPVASTGAMLQSNGSSSDPGFSTSLWPATTTINQILYSSAANTVSGLSTANNGTLITSATGVPSLLANGTTGQVLTATTGSPPSWATPATKIGTINGDSGSITGATVTIFANRTANATGATVAFINSSATSTLTLTDANDNIFVGRVCGNTTLSGANNVGIGAGNFFNLTSGGSNTGVGFSSSVAMTSGVQNSAYGRNSLGACQTGNGNCSFGFENLVSNTSSTGQNSSFGWRALNNLVGGSTNAAFGISAGSAYTGSESNNIVIAHTGVLGESNVIRIGTQGSGVGQQNVCIIAGIVGVTTSNTTVVTINSSTGQLGNVASLPIANGGTNATSMGTSNGIVKYDGTRLVTSTTAQIDSSNRTTNSSQPAFFYYCNAATTNNSGDGTNYTCLFQTQVFDNGSNFSSNTTFTAPVTGKYQFNVSVLTQNNLATHNPNFRLVVNGSTNYTFGNFGGSFTANFLLHSSLIIPLTAADTVTVVLQTSNGTKTVGVYGAASDPRTFFSGFLVC